MSILEKLVHFLHLDFAKRAARDVELLNRERSRAASARFARGNVARQHHCEESIVEFEETRAKLRGLRLSK